MTKPFLRFFRWYCHPKLRDSIEGDLMELYRERVTSLGKKRADLLFAIDVLLLFRPGIIRPAEGHQQLNQYGMFKSYFKIGWRTMLRSKVYSAINIGGLAAGMAVTILIGMWIYDEVSFDRYVENYDRIGQLMVHNGDGTYPSHPIPLAAELRRDFPDDIKRISISTWQQDLSIVTGDKKFLEPGSFMEPDGLEIFSFDMIYGTRRAIAEPNTIVISESLSKKLYGDADPVGQVVRVKNLIDVRIGGVYRDFPANSTFNKVNLFGSWELLLNWMTWMKDLVNRWDNNSWKVYVELNDGVSFEEFSAKIKDVKRKHLDAERLKYNPELFIHPMSKWHLYSEFKNRKEITSERLQMVWLYGIIGVFVLMLACINFMNLSTARSEKRAKEVGIRKTMGSLRHQLIVQFLSESFITVFIAMVCSIFLVLMALPYFNQIAAKQILFPWSNLNFWIAILCFVLIAGVLAGSYPALFLSSFKPVKILRARMNSLPRKVLVVIQFAVSVTLIVGTIVVYQQVEFARNRPVGYSPSGLIMVYMVTPDLYRHYEVLRNELLQSGFVENMATSQGPITDAWSHTGSIEWEGKPIGMQSNIAVDWVTSSYGKTIGWQLTQGRDFSDDIASDSTAVIINETAARYMNMKDPIDQVITWDNKTYRVVGVINDILTGSPYKPMQPSVFFHSAGDIYTINIRLNPALSTHAAIEGITTIFQKHNTSAPFEFVFVDDDYAKKFASEVRVGKLTSIFSGLAIMISLLGLFGLSSFVAEQRTKEIGIRKVVGASVTQLWAMLTKSFVSLVAISCLVAFPIAWYVLSNWLTKFEYRIEISPWIFPLVIAGALLTTLATVSFQALRAAMLNPVESLKSE